MSTYALVFLSDGVWPDEMNTRLIGPLPSDAQMGRYEDRWIEVQPQSWAEFVAEEEKALREMEELTS